MTLAGYDPNEAAVFWEKLYDYQQKLKKYRSNPDLIVKIKKEIFQNLQALTLSLRIEVKKLGIGQKK